MSGSQSVSMLAELGASYALVQETFKQASEVLGYDLWAVIQNGPKEKLDDTACTQPAMLAAGVAVWRIWQALNYPKPDVLADHSLGEYTAMNKHKHSDKAALGVYRGSTAFSRI
ncbi:Malonyl CoA-acyl carrier protein transacylase [hydrothermal vent metagenome]|uniref:[acyl-carrier-protein] S-malonyltransferase n=1 Tax=hydrothermal vent metagenome TaxID=652676 RepID=A0A3B0YW67_9ZZZZ